MSFLCRNILLSHGEVNFYCSSNMQVLSLLSNLLVKIKRKAKNNNDRSKKKKFFETIHRKELLRKETDETNEL